MPSSSIDWHGAPAVRRPTALDSQVKPNGRERPEFITLRQMVGKSFQATLDTRGQLIEAPRRRASGKSSAPADERWAAILGEGQLRLAVKIIRLMDARRFIQPSPLRGRAPEELPLSAMTMIRVSSVTSSAAT